MKLIRKNTHVEANGIDTFADDYGDLRKRLMYRFSIYDEITHKYNQMLMSIIPTKDETLDKDRYVDVHIYGRISDFELENLFINQKVKVNYDFDEYDVVDIELKNQPRNDDQKFLIDFLCGNLNFRYTKPHPQLLVGADTSFGKTYCTINALTSYRAKFLIIVPTTTLITNWCEEFEKHTDLVASEDLLVLNPTVYRELKEGTRDISQYKGFLVTHASITDIGNNYGWTEITWLFKALRIGTKVFDEIHKNFRNLVLTDLFTDTYKTLYLSATIKRSDMKETTMLNKFFKNMLYFGKEMIQQRSEKFIKGVVFYTKTNPDIKQTRSFRFRRGNIKGITPTMYSKYLVEYKTHIIDAVVDKAVEIFENRPYREGKLLILFTNKAGQRYIHEHITKKFPNSSCKIINSDTRKKDREFDTDIIISSASIMGTGVTIYNLVQVLMLDTYSSAITAEQIPNRLREIKGVPQIYMEMVDKSVPECERQFKNRYKTLSNMLSKIIYVDMTDIPEPTGISLALRGTDVPYEE